MSKKPFADLLEKMNLALDEPEENNIQFDFETHAKNLADFIAHDRIPTPFAIAIHGEWGSGKTTFCKLVQKKLVDIQETNILEFNAWEYERSDVFTALLFKIKKIFKHNDKSRFAKSVISFGVDAVLRRTVGMSKKDMKKHFEGFTEHINTLQKNLKDVIDHKLIIFIDDLDRCNVENTLSMLEGIKMFLNIEKIIFIVAVDMTKIERSWVLRYNINNSIDSDNIATIEGRDHVEKMFQLKLSLPHKSVRSLESYINTMTESLNDENMKFLIQNLPPNPRKIKLTLNLIYFILYNYNYNTNNADDAFISQHEIENRYLNTLITWIIITNNYKDIADFTKISPDSLIHAAVICTKFEHIDGLRTEEARIHSAINDPLGVFTYDGLEIVLNYSEVKTWYILRQIIKHDSKAFDVLKHYGIMFDLPKKFKIPKLHPPELESFYNVLSYIVEKTPL